MNGCNCAQAVFLAFADRYGIDEQTALLLASGFGGGMGRMREVCGAFSGMVMVCGMETGTADLKDGVQKAINYQAVRNLAAQFKEQNGALYCRDLLGLTQKQEAAEGAAPAERTEQYYKKRPCPKSFAARRKFLKNIWGITNKAFRGCETPLFIKYI